MRARKRSLAATACAAALLSISIGAAAQSGARDAVRPAAPRLAADAPRSDLSLRGHLGGFGDTGDDGGVVMGATVLYRFGPLAVGGLLESGGAVFGYSYGGVAGLAGLGLRPSARVRLELLGSAGAHRYDGVGRRFLSDDPGASGNSYYAGARAGSSYLFGSAATHFELGVYGSIDEDLTREVVRYQYADESWFGEGESVTREAEQTIGTRRTSVVLALGATHDFL